MGATVMEKDDGGPAFPESEFDIPPESGASYASHGGMTLRDWFAGQAIVGSTSAADDTGNIPDETIKSMAVDAYKIADAMLLARSSEQVTNG